MKKKDESKGAEPWYPGNERTGIVFTHITLFYENNYNNKIHT